MYVADMDVGITALRANLAEWLQRVREGEEVTITDHGVPVARLVPVPSSDLIERLTREGVLGRPHTLERPKAGSWPRIKLTPGVSVSEIVAQHRGGDR